MSKKKLFAVAFVVTMSFGMCITGCSKADKSSQDTKQENTSNEDDKEASKENDKDSATKDEPSGDSDANENDEASKDVLDNEASDTEDSKGEQSQEDIKKIMDEASVNALEDAFNESLKDEQVYKDALTGTYIKVVDGKVETDCKDTALVDKISQAIKDTVANPESETGKKTGGYIVKWDVDKDTISDVVSGTGDKPEDLGNPQVDIKADNMTTEDDNTDEKALLELDKENAQRFWQAYDDSSMQAGVFEDCLTGSYIYYDGNELYTDCKNGKLVECMKEGVKDIVAPKSSIGKESGCYVVAWTTKNGDTVCEYDYGTGKGRKELGDPVVDVLAGE